MRLPNDEQLATIQVKGNNDTGPAFTNGGTTQITNRTQLHLVPAESGGSSFYFQEEEADAVTELEARSKITVHGHGEVIIRKGTLALRDFAADGANQTYAVIDTDQTPINANEPTGAKSGLELGKDATLTNLGVYYCKLAVNGDFFWSGTVNLSLSRTDESCDKIFADAVRPALNTSVLNLRWGGSGAFGRQVDDRWKLVEANETMARTPNSINRADETVAKTNVDLDVDSMNKILYAEVLPPF